MDLKRDEIISLQIENNSDIGVCRRKAVLFAKGLGFDEVKTGEVAILTTELVTNVIKYGGGNGHFVLFRMQDIQGHKGLEIWCCDYGKGISNMPQVFKDGYSSGNSLGVGLGSARRLSDEFEINPEPLPDVLNLVIPRYEMVKTYIRACKWLPDTRWIGVNKKLIIGAASRPKPGENFNGDNYVICHLSENISLAAVIDGLGHGKEAHVASQSAKERILLNPDLPLNTLMEQIHRSLRGTRGATVGITRLDTELNKVDFIGIGNIEGQILSSIKKQNFTSLGGIVGHNMRTPRIFEYNFERGSNISMYSDGITSRWQNNGIEWQKQPQQIAEHILNNHARINDDATILIIRNAK